MRVDEKSNTIHPKAPNYGTFQRKVEQVDEVLYKRLIVKEKLCHP